MSKEFKVTAYNKQTTVYTLESASSGGTSSGSIASVSSPMGGVRKRGDNLIAQEANKDTVPATTPRNFVAKNAKTGGAGAHKDKKKAEKQGDVKHKNKQFDLAEAGYGRNRGYSQGFASPSAPKLGGREYYSQGAADDESNMLYIYVDGRLKQKMVSNQNERQARAQGFRDSQDEALKVHGIIRSKFDPKKFVQNQGGKWVQVFPYGEDQGVAEDHSTASGGWGQGAYASASSSSKWAGAGKDDSVHENPEWYGDEANSMSTSQLKSLVKHAAKLRQAVKAMQAQGDTLEPWQQAKVTKASDYLDAVFNAVDDEHDMGEGNHPDEKEDKALIRKMVKAQALKQEDGYMAELQAKLDEKIPKNAPVDVWIKDFEKSNAPQFRGKTKEKRRQMAVAASYGAKNPSKKK